MPSRFFKSIWALLASLFRPVRSIAPARAMFFFGILFIAIGVGLHNIADGLIVAGALMLLSLQPLLSWIK